MRRIFTLVLIALLALLVVRPQAQAPQTPAQSPRPSVCGDPTAHVYHPDRLVLMDACKTVTGTVATIRHERDGDVHIGLSLDPGQESLINDANVSGQHGNLVLEIVCYGTVTQADAVDACANYTNPLSLPSVGEHITATGPYVLDTSHGWGEIHPVDAWNEVP